MAFSSSAGVQGAGQGAQMGMVFGPQGAAIGAVAGFVLGGIEGGKEAKRAQKLFEQALANQEAQNKLVREETARGMAEISKARTANIISTADSLQYIERTSKDYKADLTVQNATADAIGASAQVMYSAVDYEKAQADAIAYRDQEYTQDNLTTQAVSLLKGARSQIQTSVRPSADISKQQIAQGLLNLGQVGGSLWANGAFDTKKEPTIYKRGGWQGDRVGGWND